VIWHIGELVPEQWVHLRAVNGFVAARRPTRALRQEIIVIDISNKNMSGDLLLLEMAFQAERLVAFGKQSLVDGAVRRMAGCTALTHRLMWKHKRPSL